MSLIVTQKIQYHLFFNILCNEVMLKKITMNYNHYQRDLATRKWVKNRRYFLMWSWAWALSVPARCECFGSNALNNIWALAGVWVWAWSWAYSVNQAFNPDSHQKSIISSSRSNQKIFGAAQWAWACRISCFSPTFSLLDRTDNEDNSLWFSWIWFCLIHLLN